MNGFLSIFALVYQVLDFVVKAIAAFIVTPEGEKEWSDILVALTGAGILHPSDVTEDVPYTDSQAAKDFQADLSDTGTTASGTPATGSSATGRQVHRMPLKHEGS